MELWRLGSRDGGDPATTFSDIWDFAVDGSGGVYVLERQAAEVRHFDAGGRHVRTLGGHGQGPGEFTNPIGLAWASSGHLWVVDQGNARYTVFDTTGQLVSTFPRQIWGWGFPWGGAFDDAGTLFEPTYITDRGTGESRHLYARFQLDSGLTPTDSFPLPETRGESGSYRIDRPDGGRRFIAIPYAPELTWNFDGRDGIWFGTGDGYSLFRQDLAGDTTHLVEVEAEPVSVSNEELDEVRAGVEQYGERHTAAILAQTPEHKPAFRRIVVSDSGFVWVARYGEGTSFDRWDVFTPDGRLLGWVHMPLSPNPPPRIRGNRMVGVLRDEFDVPYVVMYVFEARL